MNRVDDALDRLGKAAGILPGYWDIAGTRHQTSPDTTRALLAAMGLDTSTPAALQDALDRLARQRQATPLKPMTVVRTGPAGNAGIPGLSIAAGLTQEGLPVGVEIDGPADSDRRLLAIGLAIEAALREEFGPVPPPSRRRGDDDDDDDD